MNPISQHGWKMVTRTGIEIQGKHKPERVYSYLSCGHCSYFTLASDLTIDSAIRMSSPFGKKERCYQPHCVQCMRPATLDLPMDNAWVALCHEHAQLIIQSAIKRQ